MVVALEGLPAWINLEMRSSEAFSASIARAQPLSASGFGALTPTALATLFRNSTKGGISFFL